MKQYKTVNVSPKTLERLKKIGKETKDFILKRMNNMIDRWEIYEGEAGFKKEDYEKMRDKYAELNFSMDDVIIVLIEAFERDNKNA